ncbi:MAG: DUF1232 domain-containing protein [Planctomycetes bacterium]|nr:DUF1232 domain-containing protein [Planctomycetota bacterium]
MPRLEKWKTQAKKLKRETYALYLACRDPRTPWYAKALAACVVAYALSPIDLIPDPIPVLGHLDDLVLIPLGIALVLRLIPASVMDDCRRRAHETLTSGKPTTWVAAAVIILVWLILVALTIAYLWRILVV